MCFGLECGITVMSENSVSAVYEHPVNESRIQACILSNDEMGCHIDRLQKEKNVWKTLYDEKKQLASTLSAAENSSSEDETLPLITDDDLKFISEAPDYQKVGELYDKLFKNIIIVHSQHEKTKRCFNNALQRIMSLSCSINSHRTN